MVKLFCAIVGVAGSAFPVDIDAAQSVGDLKKVIAEDQKHDFAASKLQLFRAKKNGAWLTEVDVNKGFKDMIGLTPLDVAGAPLNLVGLSPEDVRFQVTMEDIIAKKTPVHVLVVIPKGETKRPAEDEGLGEILKKLRTIEADVAATKADVAATKPMTFTDFKHLSVHNDEFLLDSLYITQQSDRPIVNTPTLHEFWKEFGEFPSLYLVRMEEVIFWKVIKKLLLGKDRIVIVGSPGVGKSCFLMLIAFYLACIEKKKVLVLRCLKQSEHMNAAVFFDGRGSYARLWNLSFQDIKAIRGQAQDAIVLVDGFNQAEVQDPINNYMPFNFLATSCQYDVKHDDPSRVVVLPAWREDDLLQYAKLTNWVIDVGLHESNKLKHSTWLRLVKEQYFYSGGSLREFCRQRNVLKQQILSDCCFVENAQAFNLVNNYLGGQSKNQVDRLRRHYITDYQKEEHYCDRSWWKLSVDSGYVLSKLGRMVGTDKQLEVYKYSKSIGAGFYGIAYELLLHNAVHGAFARRKPIVLKMREGSKYEILEIQVPYVVCRGEDEASCYSCLSTLEKDTYWYPSYPFFPFVDAVTTCEAFRSGSGDSETIVAYIQVTIQGKKTFKEQRLHRLNEELDKNQSLKDMKRAFVIVGPDSGVCERFVLHNAPDPNTFLAMVSCFNPEQLESE